MAFKCLALLSLFLAVAGAGLAADNSVPVELPQTPPAVQKAIAAQIGDGELEDIHRSDEEGETTFDVDFTSKSGDEHGFSLAADGALVSIEVTLDEVPATVRNTIQAQAKGAELEGIDKNFDPAGDTFDVVAVAKNGAVNSFTVGIGGAVRSVKVALDQTSPAARKTIEDQMAGGKIIRIDKSLIEKKDKVLPYQVQGRKGGKPFNFSVGPKGRFLGMDP